MAVLMAVFNVENNWTSFTFAGDYTVDWGDGNVENFASGVKASHNYSYSAISSDTATTRSTVFRDYRQVLITITPQAGSHFTSVDFNTTASYDTRATMPPESQFLDMAIVGSSIAYLAIGWDNVATYSRARFTMLEKFTLGANALAGDLSYLLYKSYFLQKCTLNVPGATNLTSALAYCRRLYDVSLTTSSALTNIFNLFQECTALVDAPLFDTSGVTNCSQMFQVCKSLKTVPQYDWSALTTATNVFKDCYQLETVTQNFKNVPAFTMGTGCGIRSANLTFYGLTNASSMFNGCTNLKTVGYINTSNCTSLSGMFQGSGIEELPWVIDASSCTDLSVIFASCTALNKIAGFKNATSVTTMANAFQGCTMLHSIPDITTSSALTTVASMFSTSGLRVAPVLSNTSGLTAATSVFSQCAQLSKAPAWSVGGALNNMFYGCSALSDASDLTFNSNNVTRTDSMFYGCASLTKIPSLLPTKMGTVTDANQMFRGCSSLTSIGTGWVPLTVCTNVTDMLTACGALLVMPDIQSPKAVAASLIFPSSPSANNSPLSLTKLEKTSYPMSFSVSGSKLSATELNAMYTAAPYKTARTITGVVASGGVVTYTTSVDHGYQVGMTVSMTGITPSAFNLSSQVITSIPATNKFAVTNAASGTYTSGGTATPASLTFYVSSAHGVTGDDPTIATNKGWTVTG